MAVIDWKSQNIVDVMCRISDSMALHAEHLRELDGRIGDGDLGLTVTKGMAAVCDSVSGELEPDVGKLIAQCGMAFNRAAASTFGALFATALMRAGKVVQGQDSLTADDLVKMGLAAIDGIKERGKADVGDKTVLDALVPAVDALTAAISDGSSVDDALQAMLTECADGVAATIPMRSQVSRASWVGERSVGVPDPGATALLAMLDAAIFFFFLSIFSLSF